MGLKEMFNVAGYGVVVTGGATGIGLAFAEVLAENGARVTIMDINGAKMETEVARMKGLGWDVRGAVVDVTDRRAVHGAFDETVAVYGRLDVVFANAGIDPGPGFTMGTIGGEVPTRPPEFAIENYEDPRWDRVIDVNLNSVFTTVKAAARHMKPRNSGRIIITSSVASVLNEAALGAAYMASKAAVTHFMRNVALELARYNILVNSIAPGPFVTDIGGGYVHDPKVQEAFSKVVPLGRIGRTDEIKGLALFLASPTSSFITGEQILIDGGCHVGRPA